MIKEILNENPEREASLNVSVDSFSQKEVLILSPPYLLLPSLEAVVVVLFFLPFSPNFLFFILFLLCLDMCMFLCLCRGYV